MYYDLPSGTCVLIRHIEPADKARLEAGLRRLSEETIRRRFMAAKPRFSASELRYLTEVDGRRHVALVGVPADDPDTLIAVARYVALPDAPDTAELAVVVDDPFQRQGLAGAQRLMRTFSRRLESSGQGAWRDYVVDLVA